MVGDCQEAPVAVVASEERAEACGTSPRWLIPDAEAWARRQFGNVDLGDKRRNRRLVEVATRIAQAPESSLPRQMGSHARLDGAYRLLSNAEASMEALLAPHIEETLAAARGERVVLMVEDTTELDYTSHRSMKGLGSIGDGRGRGMLMHDTLALVPGATREQARLLGLAHMQVVLRRPLPKPRPRLSNTPESLLWQKSAAGVGRAPEGVRWVHVSDCGSDGYEYICECVRQGKGFVVRSQHNRRVVDGEGGVAGGSDSHLHEYARALRPAEGISYEVAVRATKTQPARQAKMVAGWGQVRLVAPEQGGPLSNEYETLTVRVVRAFEADPPQGAEGVEWLLVTSEPVGSAAEAQEIIEWYGLRWWCEDYHKCLKSGCGIERAQLSEADDIRRLLGIMGPVAVRLLQLRQAARVSPEMAAEKVVEPLKVRVLALWLKLPTTQMTIREFHRRVAQLGGFLGRRCDGEPGWQTLWRGYEKLEGLTEGARLALGAGA
jgi:hypothetical protein